MASGAATILHADLDAFYASVEQLLDPSLRDRPIAVGGGVVLAASYEAKAFGVQGGMSVHRARQLCPHLQVVGGHFRDYQRLGDRVVALMHDLTPAVERISIDEAFLDVAGTVHLFGPPATIAAQLRHRVRTEVGLPISVGVATTKHLAKVASQVAKPDGLVVVEAGHETEFLDPLPVGLLWGVGPVTRRRLAERGVHTIGQLGAASPEVLQRLLGQAAGAKLAALAHNRDPRGVQTSGRVRSVGAQSALGPRPATLEVLRTTYGHLADRVATRLRAGSRSGRTVTVRVRFADLRSVTRSHTLTSPTDVTLTLAEVAVTLAGSALADHPERTEISLLGLSVSHLTAEPPAQLELPLRFGPGEGPGGDPHRPGTPAGAARRAVDQAVDQVRARFGRGAVELAAVRFSGAGRVPDAFRELAERDLTGP